MVRSYPVVLKNMFKTTIKHTKQFSNMFCSKEGLDLISIIPLQPFKQKNQRNKTQKTSRWLFQPVFFFQFSPTENLFQKKHPPGSTPLTKRRARKSQGPQRPGRQLYWISLPRAINSKSCARMWHQLMMKKKR